MFMQASDVEVHQSQESEFLEKIFKLSSNSSNEPQFAMLSFTELTKSLRKFEGSLLKSLLGSCEGSVTSPHRKNNPAPW